MGFYATDTRPAVEDLPPKNRVMGSRRSPALRARFPTPEPVDLHQETRDTSTKTVSGLVCWNNRDPIGERGGINIYAFINNSSIDEADVLGLNPFVAGIAKCAAKLILNELLKAIDKKVLGSTACGQIRGLINDSIGSDTNWCQKQKEKSDYNLEIKDQTVIGSIAGCAFDFLSGKALDKLLEGVKDKDLKKLIEKIVKIPAGEIEKMIGDINKSVSITTKCTGKDKIEWRLEADLSANIDGFKIQMGVEEIEKGTCEGGSVYAACCNCF